LFDKLLPLECYFLGDTSVPISRQVDEVELSADPIKINQLSATRRGTGKRQLLFPDQAIQQAGLANVAPSQKRYLREGFSRKLIRLGCTYYKLRVHQAPEAFGNAEGRSGTCSTA
jgi:hypothetical protein